ncbi:hypothetical protein D5H75_16285 [Bailinhaonella thermotolerans]|uniref:Glycosyltransferase RgtA/B/C/D-like domain-containing protein n=1 Tax=Bailinhaonella thermotolerans TaxID=1070861 RepID=A0A3A4AQJ7_9ACTN|nr:hypothetical protein D5H75_16285 [Bailinhaonella thermotolerans]
MAGFLVAMAWSWRPSMWNDELATVSAITRPWGRFAELLEHRDAVVAPYYLLMRVWVLAGDSDLWLRTPSALGVAAAAGLLADLGRRLWSPRAGALAAGILLALPSVSRFGQELRPYTIALATAVFSAWALHRALERRGWPVYALSVLLLPLGHLFTALALPAHLAVVAARDRRALPRFLAALVPGVALLALVAVLSAPQRAQVAWLGAPKPQDIVFVRATANAWALTLEPWHWAVAALGWAVALIGLASAVPLWRSGAGGGRAWVGGLLLWGLLPMPVLVVTSLLVAPVYTSRYVLFAAPAFALLAGAGLARVRLPLALAALAVMIGAGLPQQVLLRSHDGHGQPYAHAAGIVSEGMRAGDAIVYAAPFARDGFQRYGSRLPDDVLMVTPASRTGGFGTVERRDVRKALDGHDRVWVVRPATPRLMKPGTDLPSRRGLAPGHVPVIMSIHEAGFRPQRSWHYRGLTLALLTR